MSEISSPLLLDAMCCMMFADGTASKPEREKVREIFRKLNSPWDDAEIDRRVLEFFSRVKSTGFPSVLDMTCDDLKKVATRPLRIKIRKRLYAIMGADGEFDRREQEVRAKIDDALSGLGANEESSTNVKPKQETRGQQTEPDSQHTSAYGRKRKPPQLVLTCPNCRAEVPDSSALCIDCGYDFQTNKVRQTARDRLLTIGGKKFVITCRGEEVLLSVPATYRVGRPWSFRPTVVDLREYTAIFTLHSFVDESGWGENSPPIHRDFYEARLMKHSWLETVRVRFQSVGPSANDSLREFIDFVTESTPDIQVLTGPPDHYWGNDRRRWWQQWDFGIWGWRHAWQLFGMLVVVGFLVFVIFAQLSH